ncbi:MAG: DUF2846 domain-containing protein [Sulfurovum sp.]|nr:DUF2846 domain-containing protein [Sulfurovum sp.]
MKPLKHILVLCLMLFMVLPLFAKVEQWDTYGAEQTTEKSQNKMAHIVIIRPDSLKGKAINIYIDGEYVSSLLPGAYTEELVCPGRHRVNLAYTNPYTRYQEKRKGGQMVVFMNDKQNVYMLNKTGDTLQFLHYPEKDIPALLKRYDKRQKHTISRLNKRKCTQPSAAK